MEAEEQIHAISKAKKNIVPKLLIGCLLLILPLALFVEKSSDTKSTRTYASTYMKADINRDGKVNFDDVAIIRQAIETGRYLKAADLTDDGMVNQKDIERFYDVLSLH